MAAHAERSGVRLPKGDALRINEASAFRIVNYGGDGVVMCVLRKLGTPSNVGSTPTASTGSKNIQLILEKGITMTTSRVKGCVVKNSNGVFGPIKAVRIGTFKGHFSQVRPNLKGNKVNNAFGSIPLNQGYDRKYLTGYRVEFAKNERDLDCSDIRLYFINESDAINCYKQAMAAIEAGTMLDFAAFPNGKNFYEEIGIKVDEFKKEIEAYKARMEKVLGDFEARRQECLEEYEASIKVVQKRYELKLKEIDEQEADAPAFFAELDKMIAVGYIAESTH